MLVVSFLFALVTIIAVQVDGKMQMDGHGSQQVVCTCPISNVTFTTACRAGTNCNQACAKKDKDCKFSAYEKKSKTRPRLGNGSGKTPITCLCTTPPSNEVKATTVQCKSGANPASCCTSASKGSTQCRLPSQTMLGSGKNCPCIKCCILREV